MDDLIDYWIEQQYKEIEPLFNSNNNNNNNKSLKQKEKEKKEKQNNRNQKLGCQIK